MTELDTIRLFGMSTAYIERDLDVVERQLLIDLQRPKGDQIDDEFYPQFEHRLRAEAEAMGRHYALFYCLERSARQIIVDTLYAESGEGWWNLRVPEHVRKSAAENLKKERESAVTARSEDAIDYTNFGELGDIVRSNWPAFGAVFNSEKGFNQVMTRLNTVRSPIAHCSPLAPDEVVRLGLTLRDWFRQMDDPEKSKAA
jgi:hypothetical protein